MRLDFSLLQTHKSGPRAETTTVDGSSEPGRDRQSCDCDREPEEHGHGHAVDITPVNGIVPPVTAVTGTSIVGTMGKDPMSGVTEPSSELQHPRRLADRGHSGLGGHSQQLRGFSRPHTGHTPDLGGLSRDDRAQSVTTKGDMRYAVHVQEWALDRCIWKDKAWGGLHVLHADFSYWCSARGVASTSRSHFEAFLEDQGFHVDRAYKLCYGLYLRDDVLFFVPRNVQSGELPVSAFNHDAPVPDVVVRPKPPAVSAQQYQLGPDWARKRG